jgi:hypothetical protein
LGKLTSESSSGVAEEVASTKLIASADQPTAVDKVIPDGVAEDATTHVNAFTEFCNEMMDKIEEAYGGHPGDDSRDLRLWSSTCIAS